MSFTAQVIVALALVFVIWAFRGLRVRGAYYNAVAREMQRLIVDAAEVDKKYGTGKYQASMDYMRKHGLSPEEAAKAIAADLTGEYNAFLEKLNAQE